jgi:hypothetical protein
MIPLTKGILKEERRKRDRKREQTSDILPSGEKENQVIGEI